MKTRTNITTIFLSSLLLSLSSMANDVSLSTAKKVLNKQEYMQYAHQTWEKDRKKAVVSDYSEQLISKINNQGGSTLTVGPGNDCGFPNILTALNFAAPGDSIFIAEGSYTGIEAKLTIDKSLSLIGGLDSNCQVFTINRTNLELNGAGPVIEINVSGGKEVTLSGLDISGAEQNIMHDYNSGIHITGDGTVTISNTHIYDNNAFDGGGISVVSGATVILNENTEIFDNTVTRFGGGIFCGNSFIYAYDVKIGRLDSETVQGNISTDNDGAGGGIYASSCELTLGETVFGNGPVEINYNKSDGGAGVYSINSTINMFHFENRISFNYATHDHSGAATAILAEGSSVINLSNIKLTDNGNASVIKTRDNSSLSINSTCENKPCSTIARNRGNYARLEGTSNVLIQETIITDGSFNTSIYVTDQGQLDIENSIISNTNTTFQPNLISCALNGVINMTNTNIVNNNLTEDQSSLLRTISGGCEINFNGGIIWGNSVKYFIDDFNTGTSITNSIIQYPPDGLTNTIQADPLFVDIENNDFHIKYESPARDYFNSNLSSDFEGDSRPQGILDDAGADEWTDLIYTNGFE